VYLAAVVDLRTGGKYFPDGCPTVWIPVSVKRLWRKPWRNMDAGNKILPLNIKYPHTF